MKEQRRGIFVAGTVLRLCLAIAFIGSLLHPATREVQALCARLLFRFLPLGGNIYVWDQSKYEWLHETPRASFTGSFCKEVHANAGRSAEDLVLALSLVGGSTFEPALPSDLEGHPLLPWATMAYADTVPTRADYWSWQWRAPSWQPPEDKVLDLLPLAQRVHPGNGALWLVEGAVHLDAGREDAGLDALRIAARKGGWDAQEDAAFSYQLRLFEAKGLPPLEAAERAFSFCRIAFATVASIEYYFGREMPKAIVGRQDARLSRLLEVLMELAKQTWKDRSGALVHSFCICQLGPSVIEEALLERLKRSSPASWRSVPAEWAESPEAQAMVKAYLSACVGSRTTDALFRSCAAKRQLAQDLGPPRRYDPDLYGLPRYMCGLLAFLLQAFIIAIFLLHLPSRFFRPDSLIKGLLPRNASFWVPAAIAAVLGTALLTTAFVAVSTISGHWIGLVWDALLLATAATLVLLFCKLGWLSEHPGFRLVPMTVVVMGFVYLGAVGATAYFRSELLRAILAAFSA